jgi:hypothetical protein
MVDAALAKSNANIDFVFPRTMHLSANYVNVLNLLAHPALEIKRQGFAKPKTPVLKFSVAGKAQSGFIAGGVELRREHAF